MLPLRANADRSVRKESEVIIATLFVCCSIFVAMGPWVTKSIPYISFQYLKAFVELNSSPLQVPKYLSQQWEKATGRGEVGRLRICKYVKATAIKHTA